MSGRLHEHRDGADGGEKNEKRRKKKEENDLFFLSHLHPLQISSTSTFSPLLFHQKTKKQEYVNGQLKNKYGDAFIRGNNVLYISTDKGASS